MNLNRRLPAASLFPSKFRFLQKSKLYLYTFSTFHPPHSPSWSWFRHKIDPIPCTKFHGVGGEGDFCHGGNPSHIEHNLFQLPSSPPPQENIIGLSWVWIYVELFEQLTLNVWGLFDCLLFCMLNSNKRRMGLTK